MIPGSNPGAPASDARTARATLGAVVMAAGLGTRMRSDIPKHLHPLLGRRMVDWVLERRARARRRPARRGRVARDRGGVRRRRRRGPGASRAGRATRFAARAPRSRGARPTCSCSRATRPRSPPSSCASSSRPTAAKAPRRPSSRSSPTTRSSTAASLRNARRRARGDRRVPRRDRRAARGARGQLVHLRLPGRRLWPVLDRLTPHNAQGELYLTDSVALLVADGDRVAVHKGGDPVETEGVNTRVELAAAGGGAPRPDQRGAHARRGHDRRSRGATWIDAEAELEPDAVDPSVHGDSRRARASPRAPRSARTRCSSTPIVGRGRPRGPFCYLRPGTVLEAGAKAGTFVEIKNSRIGERTKVPHLTYLGDADVGADTNIAAGNITANQEHTRVKERTTIGQQRQDGCRQYVRRPGVDRRRRMDCSRLRHHRGCTSGRARDRPRATGEQGRTRWKAERLSRRCPGSSDRRSRGCGDDRPRDPAHTAEAADGVRRPFASRAGGEDRRAARRRARRDRADDVRERRDVLPLLRVDSRRGRVPRPDGLRPGRPEPHGAAPHDPGGASSRRRSASRP